MMKAVNYNLTHKILIGLGAITSAMFLYACAASAPVTPIQIPSSIEFADNAIVLNMQDSISLSADGDFSAGEVKFTDLSTGEIDESGKCGTSTVEDDVVVLTGPNNWPNAQSRCTVCFEYDGACLPVNFNASPSIVVPNGLDKVAPLASSSELEPEVIVSLGTAPFGVEESDGILYQADGTTRINGTLRDLELYEHAKGTREYSYALYSCIQSLVSSGDNFVRGPYVVMSSDGSATDTSVVSSYDEIKYTDPENPDVVYTYDEISDFITFDRCSIAAADDANGVKKIVTAANLLTNIGEGEITSLIYLGTNTTTLSSVYSTSGGIWFYGVELDSTGKAHIFFGKGNIPNHTLYQLVCNGSTCSEPEVIANNVREVQHNIVNYNGTIYLGFVKSPGAIDAQYDMYVMPITATKVDTENLIRITTDDFSRGKMGGPEVGVGMNSLNNKLILVGSYSFDDVNDKFAKYLDITNLSAPVVSNELQINSEESSSAIYGGLTMVLAAGEVAFGYSFDTNNDVVAERETKVVYTRAGINADGEFAVIDNTNAFSASLFASYDGDAVATDTGKVYGLVSKSNFFDGTVTEGMSLGMATYTSAPKASAELNAEVTAK